LTAEECLSELTNQKLRKIDDLPKATGVYGLADHLGNIHYIGVTAADSFLLLYQTRPAVGDTCKEK
jgi:hypothetical protein